MFIRSAVFRTLLLVITSIIVLPVASQFAIELADDFGIFGQPVDSAVNFLLAITDNSTFWAVLWVMLGFTSGVWFEYFVRQLKITIIRPDIPTRTKVQFTAGSTGHVLLENENVARITAERVLVGVSDENGSNQDHIIIWYVFLVFNRPTHYGQIVVDAGNATIPEWQVISATYHSAIVRFNGDIGNVALEIKTISAKK